MRRFISVLLGVIAGAVLAAPSFAAGWALTADTPLSYSFDKGIVNQPFSGSNTASWTHRTTTDVSGSKVLLIAPFHLGAGYEDYTVSQTVGSCGAGCTGKVRTNLQIVDVVIDIPMRFLNIGLGYGEGQANTDVMVGGNTPLRHMNVSQTFVTLGIPLGASLDIHAGYHWVSVEKKDFLAGATNPSQILLSGEMLSAGLRLNF